MRLSPGCGVSAIEYVKQKILLLLKEIEGQTVDMVFPFHWLMWQLVIGCTDCQMI